MNGAPAADNFVEPSVAEAVAASKAEVAAILAEDTGAFVNSPRGTINRRDDTLAAFHGGFIRYSSFDGRIEYAGKLGEFVVIMGIARRRSQRSNDCSFPKADTLTERHVRNLKHHNREISR
jgi:hypothetical protein